MRNFSLPRWSTIVDTTLDVTLGTHRRAERAYKKLASEAAPAPKINRIKMHGFGLTKYSIFHPFGRKTKTTFHALKRFWPERTDNALNEHNSTQVQPEYDAQYFAPIPIDIDPKLKGALSLLPSDRYQADLLRKCKITFADAEKSAASLLHELDLFTPKLALHRSDVKSARVPLLLALRRACNDVAEVTGETVSENNVVKALTYLREQNLFASVLNPPLKSTTRHLTPNERIAQDLAWRIVYKMAITENGMELLSQLTNTPKPRVGEQIDDAEKNRLRRQHLNLKHFFKTADKLLEAYIDLGTDPRPQPLLADPSTLLRYCCRQCEKDVPPPNTLLIHGLPGIQQVMCEEEKRPIKSFWKKRIDRTELFLKNNAGNARQPGTDRISGNLSDSGLSDDQDVEVNANRTALTVLRERQQIAMKDRFAYKWVSDGHYSNAPGSFLYHANERFKKIEVLLQRREMRHARTRKEAFFKRTREIITAKNRTFVPSSGVISPQHNPDSMLLHREVMRSMLYQAEEMLLRDHRLIACSKPDSGASGYKLETGPHRPVLNQIARLALIRQWQKKQLHHLSNNLAPTDLDIDNLLAPESLKQLFGKKHPALSGSQHERDTLIAAFREAIPREALTPELLLAWVYDVEFDKSVPNEQARQIVGGRKHSAQSQVDLMDEFAESLAHLQQGYTSSLVMSGEPVEDFKNAVADEIKHMRLGNVRTFSGGVTRGFNIPSFSELLSMAKSFGMVRLVITGNYGHRSLANLEAGIPSSGGFIRFTGSHEDEGGASIGVTVGPKFDKGTTSVGAYGTAAIEGGGSFNRAKGISLSLPRGGPAMTGRDGVRPGVNGDADLANRLAMVSRILTDTDDAPPSPNDLFPTMRKLRRISEAAPDISLSMIREGDSRSKEGNAGARTGFQLGVTDKTQDYGFNFNASANANYAHRRTRFRQRHGALDVEVINRGVRKSVGFLARLPILVGLSRKDGSYAEFDHGQKHASKFLGSPFGAFAVNAELWKSGIAHQTTRIIYDGKISKNSYGNIFYLNAKQFTDAAEKNIAKWVNYAALHDPDCPALPASQDSEEDREKTINVEKIRRGLVAKHTETFRKYIAHVKETAHQSNVYFDFLELTPRATDMLNKYYQLEIELRAAECHAEADACKKAFDTIWDHDDAWAPYFIVNSIPQQSNSGASINLGLTFVGEQLSTSNTFTDYWGG